jgi:hypothetical protein
MRSITSTPTTNHLAMKSQVVWPPFETPPLSDQSSFINQSGKEVNVD